MSTRTTPQADAEPEGRFYALMQELAPARRRPYRLTADLVLPQPTAKQVRAFRAATTEDEQFKALAGDAYSAVMDLFDDQPYDVWRAFTKDYYEHYFGNGAQELPGGSSGS